MNICLKIKNDIRPLLKIKIIFNRMPKLLIDRTKLKKNVAFNVVLNLV
jgi:hypothetical protein